MNKKQREALRAKLSDGKPSSAMMVSTLSEWYDAKHRRASPEEVAFINSLPAGTCPHCGSPDVRSPQRYWGTFYKNLLSSADAVHPFSHRFAHPYYVAPGLVCERPKSLVVRGASWARVKRGAICGGAEGMGR